MVRTGYMVRHCTFIRYSFRLFPSRWSEYFLVVFFMFGNSCAKLSACFSNVYHVTVFAWGLGIKNSHTHFHFPLCPSGPLVTSWGCCNVSSIPKHCFYWEHAPRKVIRPYPLTWSLLPAFLFLFLWVILLIDHYFLNCPFWVPTSLGGFNFVFDFLFLILFFCDDCKNPSTKVQTTLSLGDSGWWDENCKYWSVCVFLRYTSYFTESSFFSNNKCVQKRYLSIFFFIFCTWCYHWRLSCSGVPWVDLRTLFWSWNIFYGHSLPSADSRTGDNLH